MSHSSPTLSIYQILHGTDDGLRAPSYVVAQSMISAAVATAPTVEDIETRVAVPHAPAQRVVDTSAAMATLSEKLADIAQRESAKPHNRASLVAEEDADIEIVGPDSDEEEGEDDDDSQQESGSEDDDDAGADDDDELVTRMLLSCDR